MKRLTWLTGLALLLTGCATVDYMGESYAPTSHVDVYYSESNVPRAYIVMGEVVATGDMLVSAGKMQDKIREEAMKRGADAVVLTELERYTSGENTTWSQDESKSKDKKGRTHVNTSGSSSTSAEEKKKIRAIFIRYKTDGEAKEVKQ